MKINRFKTLVAGIVAGMFLFSSCSKEGPIGPQGVAGTNGVANIQTSFVTVNTADWAWSSSGYWYSDFSGVTISNNAAVLVYLVDNSSANVSLPLTYEDAQYYFRSGTTYIEMDVSSASGTTTNTLANPGPTNYKIVIIPPAMLKPHVNHTNYAEVKAAYHLKD
jgi:hypothetical protein